MFLSDTELDHIRDICRKKKIPTSDSSRIFRKKYPFRCEFSMFLEYESSGKDVGISWNDHYPVPSSHCKVSFVTINGKGYQYMWNTKVLHEELQSMIVEHMENNAVPKDEYHITPSTTIFCSTVLAVTSIAKFVLRRNDPIPITTAIIHGGPHVRRNPSYRYDQRSRKVLPKAHASLARIALPKNATVSKELQTVLPDEIVPPTIIYRRSEFAVPSRGYPFKHVTKRYPYKVYVDVNSGDDLQQMSSVLESMYSDSLSHRISYRHIDRNGIFREMFRNVYTFYILVEDYQDVVMLKMNTNAKIKKIERAIVDAKSTQ